MSVVSLASRLSVSLWAENRAALTTSSQCVACKHTQRERMSQKYGERESAFPEALDKLNFSFSFWRQLGACGAKTAIIGFDVRVCPSLHPKSTGLSYILSVAFIFQLISINILRCSFLKKIKSGVFLNILI